MTQVVTRRGSSGALIECTGDHVVKWSRDPRVVARLHEQARWLRRASPLACAQVTRVVARGYVMPRYDDLDRTIPYFDEAWLGMLGNLACVWGGAPAVKLDMPAHEDKVDALGERYLEPDGRELMRRMRKEINWDTLHRCLTHGDPTIENVMWCRARTTGFTWTILIDPLPATPAVPDVRAVDVGKLLQSAVGWERIRYGDPGLVADPTDILDYICRNDENERRAAWYWCAVHLLRAMPYVDEEVTRELKRLPPLRGL